MTSSGELIGQNIRRARLRAGLSQSELAIRIDKTRSMIAKYESGSHSPRAVTLVALAKALSVTPNDLLSDVEPDGMAVVRRGRS
jgi:transcriptional regulator with XRE-family HTH domain